MTVEHKAYCFRSEPRKVIPGVKNVVGQRFEQDIIEENNDLWVVVKGDDETYITSKGVNRKFTHMFFVDDYYEYEDEADIAAHKYHEVTNCSSKRCAWNEEVPKKDLEKKRNKPKQPYANTWLTKAFGQKP